MYAPAYQSHDYVHRARVMPAVLAACVNLSLIYLVAVGMGVAPKPFAAPEPIQLVDIPPIQKPEVIEVHREQPRTNFERPTLTAIVPDLEVVSVPQPTLTITMPDINESSEPQTGMVPDVSITPAKLMRHPEPPYPSLSRLSGEEGVVYVRVTLSPSGVVNAAQLERSSGFSRLDDAALKAIRAWRFSPAMQGAQAVTTSVVVPVKFVLRD